MPFLDEIVARLVAQGVGVFGTNIFSGKKSAIPAGDGPYLLLIETGGTGSSRTQNNTATERPTAQVSVRASTAPVARAMLKAAYDALGGADGLHNVTLSGTTYLSIVPRQNITDIGLDSVADRAFFAFNIDVEKQPS